MLSEDVAAKVCMKSSSFLVASTAPSVLKTRGAQQTMLRSHKSDIVRVAKAHGASNVRVFGSVARGTATPTSDVDLLVDFQSGRTLVDHVRLWRELEALLGTGVDVISAGGLTERDDDIRADALAL
jgi:hypothetical protein